MTVQVADRMSRTVHTTTPGSKAVDAALVIALHDITALPVLADGRLVGMFSQADLLRGGNDADQSSLFVRDVMHPVELTATPETDVAELAAAMGERGVASVPVLDGDKLVGIITRRDLRE